MIWLLEAVKNHNNNLGSEIDKVIELYNQGEFSVVTKLVDDILINNKGIKSRYLLKSFLIHSILISADLRNIDILFTKHLQNPRNNIEKSLY